MIKQKRPLYIYHFLSNKLFKSFFNSINYTKYFLKYQCFINWHKTNPMMSDIFNKQEYNEHFNIISSNILKILFSITNFIPSFKFITDSFKPIIILLDDLVSSIDNISVNSKPKENTLLILINQLELFSNQLEQNSLEKVYNNSVDIYNKGKNNIPNVNVSQITYENYMKIIILLTIPTNWSYEKNKQDIENKLV